MTVSDGAALGIEAARRLVQLGRGQCRIEAGLTARDFARVEADFGFEFADDHRAFLAAGLPVSVPHEDQPGVIHAHREPWPDWRDGDPEQLRERLSWPVEGVLFDVQHNAFWHDSWDQRPAAVEEALSVAREYLATVPTLVPVYGHRYLPAGHGGYGHPVLSVWQTDIISYGRDLADYVNRESGTLTADRDGEAWSLEGLAVFWRDFL